MAKGYHTYMYMLLTTTNQIHTESLPDMDDGCGLGGGGGIHDHIKTFYYHIMCIVEYSYTSVTQSKTRCHEELDIERPKFRKRWKGEGIQQNT